MQQPRKFFGILPDQLLFIALVYIAAIMPFQRPEIPIWPGIALMVMAWLVSGNLLDKLKQFLSNRTALVFAAPYVFYAIGFFYSENKDYATTDLILKIPLLLFPVVFSSANLEKRTDTLLKIFLYAALLCSVFSIARAAYLTCATGENYFYYTRFTIFLHVGYYAMFLVFAACTGIYFLFREESKTRKIFLVSCILFFTFIIFLLSARAQLVALFFLIFSAVLFFFFYRKKWLQGSVILASVIVTVAVVFTLLPKSKQRILIVKTEIKAFLAEETPEHYNSVSSRILIWQSAVEVIRSHPFFGAGTGDAKDKLLEALQKNNHLKLVNNNVNYHNQFLQTWAAIGLPGLLALLSFLAFGFISSLEKKKFLAASFFVLIAVSFFTEAMLERQAGVIFYSFFGALLTLANRENDS